MKRLPAILITVALITLLLYGSLELPAFGQVLAPAHNDLSRYYLEHAADETGAANIITGVILDYRAFDTFIESSVLFTAAIAVWIVLKKSINPN